MQRSAPSAVQWSDLPHELLGIVRSKVNSLSIGVRLAAVCKTWRAAVSLLPAPPALPLLLISPSDWTTATPRSLYCPEDDSVVRVPLPRSLTNSIWYHGSYDGGWIAVRPTPKPCPSVIVNVFSGTELTLSEKHEGVSCPGASPSPVIWKIIFSEAPTSSSCILAAMATENLMETDSKFYIALRRLGCPDGWRKIQGHDKEGIADIMFYRGKLYGLTRFSECLLRLDIGVDDNGAPVVTAARRLAVQKRDGPKSTGKRVSEFSTYLFELRGNLAMAVKAIWSKQTGKPYLRVYEHVDTTSTDDTHIYKWSEVHSLGSHALFLGPRCSSKAVDVPAGGRGGVEGNHIYYTSHYCLPEEEEEYKPCVTRSVDAGTMYFMDEQSVGDGCGDLDRIPSLGYYVRGSIYLPTWCFPPDM
jgi:hypothetical protein